MENYKISDQQIQEIRYALMDALNNTQLKYSEWNIKGDATMIGIYSKEISRILECNQTLLNLEKLIEEEQTEEGGAL